MTHVTVALDATRIGTHDVMNMLLTLNDRELALRLPPQETGLGHGPPASQTG